MPKLYFNSTRYADLPLHCGHVPTWLAKRMTMLGGAVIESIILEYGKSAVLTRLSDPFWFQAFGSVLGMDWHSSGITTSVMGALKRSVNPKSKIGKLTPAKKRELIKEAVQYSFRFMEWEKDFMLKGLSIRREYVPEITILLLKNTWVKPIGEPFIVKCQKLYT